MCPVLSRNDREGGETYTCHDLKKNRASTGKMIIVTTSEIARLEMIVTGIALIYSPMIQVNQKYKGTKIAMVVEVQKIRAFP
ncbi:TPA: hypothetical protein DCZ39_06350 [Patescibacteria group bacterium]|nr:hypothetical protein [Candidatus Gracilibacteria bacterium]